MSVSGSGETASGSIEVSVPTDLTVTSEGDSIDPRLNVNRQARDLHFLTVEKNQLQLATEKLRLSLQEKEAQLLSSKAQFQAILNQRNVENEMKLSEKQANVNRLEAELMGSTDELRLLKERAAKELANLVQKCYQLQQNQMKLMVKHEDVKSSLNELNLSEDEFLRLRDTAREQLTLQQFVSLRVYEMVAPLRMKTKDLETAKSSLQGTLSSRDRELDTFRRENEKMEKELSHLRERLVEYSSQCEELRSEMKLDDFRVHNFDRIKRERDKCETERDELLREKSEIDVAFSVCKRERKIMEERMIELKGKLRLQEQELSKYRMECMDSRSQLEKGKEDTLKTSSRLKLEQERSEDIHEKFLKAREENILLTDSLQDARNQINSYKESALARSEIEKDMRERLNDVQKRHADVSVELETLQGKYVKEKDSLKLELRELRANYNSLLKTYNELMVSNNTLLKENKETQQSIQDGRTAKDEEIIRLKQETINLKTELDKYTDLENDYLATLKVYAAVPADGNIEIATGTSIPGATGTSIPGATGTSIPVSTIVKGKLSEETISLTRRILQLERENIEARSTLRNLTTSLDQMRSSLSSYKSALALAGKPSTQLLEKIKSQEEQIIVMEKALTACSESRDKLKDDLKISEEQIKISRSSLKEMKVQDDEVRRLEKDLSNLRNWVVQHMNKTKNEALPSAITITKER